MKKLTDNKQDLQDYLSAQNWLLPNEQVLKSEVPGEGNMNFTLRIVTNNRSFIVKQSRAYVEKYPQVAAPAQRALREAEFYQLTAKKEELGNYMPALLQVDSTNHILMLEDLGAGTDFTFLYHKGKTIIKDELTELMEFLATLHNSFSVDEVEKPITNREMRALNHEHMYVYPYLKNNGLNLDDIQSGLEKIAQSFKEDEPLKEKARTLGKHYLSDGEKLLHGDFFPGSWLKTESGIKVIDPEFCFFGSPEFEVGICLAHLKMSKQPTEVFDHALNTYTSKAALNKNLCFQFMAGEILRRILGLAQLPLDLSLEERKSLLEEARELLLN